MVIKKASDTLEAETKATKATKSSPKSLETKPSSSCCMGTTSCSTTKSANTYATEIKKGLTRIIVKYDVGFHNSLYIRGKGANLSWDRGIPLKNVKADEWLWETDVPFTSCEFKILINDKHYEMGINHTLHQGANLHYTPKF